MGQAARCEDAAMKKLIKYLFLLIFLEAFFKEKKNC